MLILPTGKLSFAASYLLPFYNNFRYQTQTDIFYLAKKGRVVAFTRQLG